jgi:hypothetical protein
METSQRVATLADIEWLEAFYESIMRSYYVEFNCEWDNDKFRKHFDVLGVVISEKFWCFR